MSESPWTRAETVRGFVQSPPNQTLLRFASDLRARHDRIPRALDIGCGAARNAVPLANSGWDVYGVDTSWPMLAAAAERRATEATTRLHLAQATMTDLPFAEGSFDLVIAHGVWNLGTSDAALRDAIADAARVTAPGGGLFVFTFSRHTVPADAAPLPGQTYVYDQFSGLPQIFLTAEQLMMELSVAGFEPDAAVPLTEHNRAARASLASSAPVIWEAAFKRR